MMWLSKTAQRLPGTLALIAALSLTGCGTTGLFSNGVPAATEAAASAPAMDTNAVGIVETALEVADSVKIEFSGNANAPASHEEIIKGDGTITLAYIGSIKAAGKTPRELQAEIQAAYVPDYFVQLNVTVTPAVRIFWVGGEVRSPDRHPYVGPTTVTRAIQASGDFTPFANQRGVKVIRFSTKKLEIVDCKAAQKNPDLDPPVYPGDQITVPRRWF